MIPKLPPLTEHYHSLWKVWFSKISGWVFASSSHAKWSPPCLRVNGNLVDTTNHISSISIEVISRLACKLSMEI